MWQKPNITELHSPSIWTSVIVNFTTPSTVNETFFKALFVTYLPSTLSLEPLLQTIAAIAPIYT